MSSAISKLKKLFSDRINGAESLPQLPVEEEDLEIDFVSNPINNTCPITRRDFEPGEVAFQCWHCNLMISLPGYEFLKQHEKGQCCGCGGVATLKMARVPE